MCQREDCKYIEIVVDIKNKKKWFIHYKMVQKYKLEELYREEVDYIEEMESENESDSDNDSSDGLCLKYSDIKRR